MKVHFAKETHISTNREMEYKTKYEVNGYKKL